MMHSAPLSRFFVFFLTFFVACSTAFSYSASDSQGGKMRSIHTFEEKRRVALVIGNEAYHSSPLLNPVNDARAMGRTLQYLGFDVKMATDLTWREMNAAIDHFGKRLGSGAVGLFYYAGHGVQLDGRNYLIPIDADIQHEKEVKYKGIDADFVLAEMENSGEQMNIMILDACRGNPFFRSFRTTSEGLSFMEAPLGTIIAYATGPGKNASDGDGVNGIYTSELIKHLQIPGLRLVDMFNQVRRAVRIRTKGRQIPWESTSLESAFYFIPPGSQIDVSNKIKKPDVIFEPSAAAVPASYNVSETPPQPAPADGAWTEVNTRMQFVWVAGGCYQMGCGHWSGSCEEDENPVHTVCIGDFWMSKYEVTHEQFALFLNDVGHKGPDGESWIRTDDQDSDSHIVIGPNGFEVERGYEKHPVIGVSWYGARAFAKWLSDKTGHAFNLPAEAEWEYAARSGGRLEKYAGGDDVEQLGWHLQNSGGEVQAVGLKRPNGLGLYDMSGNVWEWCRDIYARDAYLRHGRENPCETTVVDFSQDGAGGRVIRGGSALHDPGYGRCANRGSHTISGQTRHVGFRIMRTSQDRSPGKNQTCFLK